MKSINGGSATVADVWSILKNSAPQAHEARWLRWHPAELDACIAERGRRLPEPLTQSELNELREAHLRLKGNQCHQGKRRGDKIFAVHTTSRLHMFSSLIAIDLQEVCHPKPHRT